MEPSGRLFSSFKKSQEEIYVPTLMGFIVDTRKLNGFRDMKGIVDTRKLNCSQAMKFPDEVVFSTTD